MYESPRHPSGCALIWGGSTLVEKRIALAAGEILEVRNGNEEA